MPLFRKFHISANTFLGLWKIEEEPEQLISLLNLSPAENEYYKSLRSELRKKHWLSYRSILTNLMDKESLELIYDAYGKPYPVNRDYHLSVTHSGLFSAVIISIDGPVGIDIEMLKDRVERVKDKFLSAEECASIGTVNRLEKLYICWGAKESLYKLYGKPEVEFARDIRLDSFEYDPKDKGECSARMTTPEGTRNYPIHYEKIEDYMLVYSMEDSRQ